jgi:hypothetical protein
VFENVLFRIRKPSSPIVWKEPFEGQQLAIFMIELRRDVRLLQQALYNIGKKKKGKKKKRNERD